MSHGVGLIQGPVLRPQPQLPPPGAMHSTSAMPGDTELFSEVLKVGREPLWRAPVVYCCRRGKASGIIALSMMINQRQCTAAGRALPTADSLSMLQPLSSGMLVEAFSLQFKCYLVLRGEPPAAAPNSLRSTRSSCERDQPTKAAETAAPTHNALSSIAQAAIVVADQSGACANCLVPLNRQPWSAPVCRAPRTLHANVWNPNELDLLSTRARCIQRPRHPWSALTSPSAIAASGPL